MTALIPKASDEVVQVATPAVRSTLSQPAIETVATTKFTVPVGTTPLSTAGVAVKVTGVVVFWGEAGDAARLVVEVAVARVTVVGTELVAS